MTRAFIQEALVPPHFPTADKTGPNHCCSCRITKHHSNKVCCRHRSLVASEDTHVNQTENEKLLINARPPAFFNTGLRNYVVEVFGLDQCPSCSIILASGASNGETASDAIPFSPLRCFQSVVPIEIYC